MKTTSPLGPRLAALRRGRGLTQRQLASAAGLHLMCVAKLEQGSRGAAIRHDTLRRLAAALDCDLAELA